MNVRDNTTPTLCEADEAAQMRAAEPVRHAGPVPPASRVEALLAAVVAACECMVQQPDLLAGLQAAMAQLGRLSGHDRAYVWELTDEQTVCVCIAEWDAPGIPRIADMAGMDTFAVADFLEVWTPLLAGSVYQSVTPVKTGANAWLNETVSNRSDVMVPIFVGERCWGCIGFDNCTEERRYGEAEVQALRGAASAVAAAVHRSQSDARLAREAQRHRQLLAAVNEASAHLVAQPDLQCGLELALGTLRAHMGVDRVFLNRYAIAEQATYFWLESHRQGLPPFVQGFGPGPWPDDEFAEVAHPLREGRTYRSVRDARSGANAEANLVNQSRSDLIVPVIVDGQYRACIGFDDCTQARHWSDAEVAVLQTAASAIAAALARHDVEVARLQQERHRADEALAINSLLEGVVKASRALLDANGFQEGLQRWLAFLAQAVDADAAMLGSFEEAPPEGALTSFSSYWARDGSSYIGNPIPLTSDFVLWSHRLHRGEWIWAHRDELQDPASVAFWLATDCFTNLLMPVVCDGRTVGWLGFDWREREPWRAEYAAALRTAADGVAAALHRQQAVQAMLAERERRVAVEQARADEAALHAERTERRSRLLAAVAQTAEQLLAARDLAPCLDAVLSRIGQITSADRMVLTRIDWTPDDQGLHGRQEIVHEWTQGGAVRQRDTQHRWIEMCRDDDTWDLLWTQLRRHGHAVARIADLAEPFRSTQRALGVTWTLMYPVEVGGVLRGLLGFDYSTDIDDHDDTDLAALQTVASTMAHALWRQELEARALAAERARADESAHLARLLGHVVSSSRTLIDADLQAFEPALKAWLGGFGVAVGAIRCTFYDLVDFEATGLRTTRMLAEWVRDGIEGSSPVSFAEPVVIDPRGAEPLMAQLTSGRAVAFHTEDTADPMRAFLAQQGNATVVAVPLVMDGKPWGCLSFDHAARRDPQPGEFAVLQTAADTLVAILKRNEALQRMLGEREARLQNEQRRYSEMAAANRALRASLAALAESTDEGGFTRQALTEVWAASGASAAYLFRTSDTDGKLRMVGNVHAAVFSPEPLPTDPPMFRRAFELLAPLRDSLVQQGRLLWRRLDPADLDPLSEGALWHQQQSHRAEAFHALLVGERVVGLMGLVFETDDPLPRAKEELIQALCQPLTLATELARLARQAQRSGEQNAVLTERSRLAREIHDGIAQSFLAIQMQLDELDPVVQTQLPLVQAMHMARHGLTEARRAVAALRPHGLLNRDLPAGVHRLLKQLGAHGPVHCVLDSPPDWQCLPPEVEDHLFRIVQEAANNALKHAQARNLRVELSQAAGEATVLIADDGVGFDLARLPAGHGFGLESMQQRAQLIGARIDWLSQPGKGTQVLVSWVAAALPDAHNNPGSVP